MLARHAFLLTPPESLRPPELLSCKQLSPDSPRFPLFVFKRLHTLSFSVSRKSCLCHSYENCRVCTNNSHCGTRHAPLSLATILKFFLFILFRTLLHSPKTQPFYFHAIPHSLPKTTRGGGRGAAGSANREEEKWRGQLADTSTSSKTGRGSPRPYKGGKGQPATFAGCAI